jgi:hypothetical protein
VPQRFPDAPGVLLSTVRISATCLSRPTVA